MRADDADVAAFQACFARNSERPRSLDSLKWQYLENPTRKLFVDFGVSDAESRVAAIYASMPGVLRVHGEKRFAIQSVDTLTDADFRGRGLFVTLAKATYARAAAEGAALVYGFPNGNSAHGFYKRLGWSSLDPVPFLVRPIRARYFAQRLPGRARSLAGLIPDIQLPSLRPRLPRGTRLVRSRLFDERVTELWADFAHLVGIAIERDAEYLNWRIARKPGESYEILSLETEGRLDAICVYTVNEKHGGRIGYVMELLHRNGAQRAGAALLGIAVREMIEHGADAALAWCLPHSPNYRAYQRNLFFTLPEKLRPIELHAGVRAFDETLALQACDRNQWYLSYLDADTV